MIRKSYHLLQDAIFGSIIYNMMDMEPYVEFLNRNDKTIEKAIELYKEGKTKPTAPKSEVKKSNKRAFTSPIYAGSLFHEKAGNCKSLAINFSSSKNDKKGNTRKHKA